MKLLGSQLLHLWICVLDIWCSIQPLTAITYTSTLTVFHFFRTSHALWSPVNFIVSAVECSFGFMVFTAYIALWEYILCVVSDMPNSSIVSDKFWVTISYCHCEARGGTSFWARNYVRQWKYRIYLCVHYLTCLLRTRIITIKYREFLYSSWVLRRFF